VGVEFGIADKKWGVKVQTPRVDCVLEKVGSTNPLDPVDPDLGDPVWRKFGAGGLMFILVPLYCNDSVGEWWRTVAQKRCSNESEKLLLRMCGRAPKFANPVRPNTVVHSSIRFWKKFLVHMSPFFVVTVYEILQVAIIPFLARMYFSHTALMLIGRACGL